MSVDCGHVLLQQSPLDALLETAVLRGGEPVELTIVGLVLSPPYTDINVRYIVYYCKTSWSSKFTLFNS